MWNVALPIVSGLMSAVSEKRSEIAKSSGVNEDVFSSVVKSVEEFLTKDERALKLTMQHIEQARMHDLKTFDKSDVFSNRLRSLVRPLCTFVALFWYVYARVNDIPLTQEDYAIVGGVLAFWFGFRPFEKRK